MNILQSVWADGQEVFTGQNITLDGHDYTVEAFIEHKKVSWVYLYSAKYDDYQWCSLSRFRNEATITTTTRA